MMHGRIARKSILIGTLLASVGATLPIRAATLLVTGTIESRRIEANVRPTLGIEATFKDESTGDLAGVGLVHIFSSEPSGSDQLDIIGIRRIRTARGEVLLSEVGSLIGDVVTVTSTVIGGTGAFKGATGQLALNGIRGTTGVSFIYSGTIILP